MTGTFKHKKVGLRHEGWDADGEAVFLRDDAKKTFKKIDAAVREGLKTGAIRV